MGKEVKPKLRKFKEFMSELPEDFLAGILMGIVFAIVGLFGWGLYFIYGLYELGKFVSFVTLNYIIGGIICVTLFGKLMRYIKWIGWS